MRNDEWRDLVCDRGRDRIPGHKPRYALTALAKNCAEQPRIKRFNLVEQHDQDKTAGQEPDDPDGRPAEAEGWEPGST